MATFWIGGIKYTGKLKSIGKKRQISLSKSDGFEISEVKVKKPPSDKMVENIRRMKGCGVVVKALRVCFNDLLKLYTDVHITGRLMKLVSEIYMRSPVGEGSKRGFFFSANQPLLGNIRYNIKVTRVEALQYMIEHSHSLERNEVTLKFTGFKIRWEAVKGHNSHYRLFHHICVIPDYAYSEASDSFEPLGVSCPLSVIVFSEYMDVFSEFTGEIVTRLPEGVVLTEADSVIQSVGIEFFNKWGVDNYSYYYGGSGVKIVDVF
jgi:hypothetical protein